MKRTNRSVADVRPTSNPVVQPALEIEPLTASVTWIPGDTATNATRTLFASPVLLDEELYSAKRLRVGHRYPGQKNFHGFYYFSQTGSLVWHESLLESTTMRWLDLHADIVAITSQPCEIEFSDGTSHVPDLLALHADHRQVLYDVKPTKFLQKAQAQFDKARTVCAAIGWGYEVHTDLVDQVRISLEYISHFRHPRFNPGPIAIAWLLDRITADTTIRDAAHFLQMASLGEGRSAVYHLIAVQILRIELNAPVSDNTNVKRIFNAHA